MNKKKEGLKNENQLSIFDSSIAEETKNDNEAYITLFPSSWFYNASVIGFLSVLGNSDENILKEIEKDWLKDDGTVRIPKSFLIKTEFIDKEEKQELLKILKIYVEYEINDKKSLEWKKEKKDKITNELKYEITSNRFKNIDFGYKFIQFGNQFFGGKYKNLIQISKWEDISFSNYLKIVIKEYGYVNKNKKNCLLCSSNEAIDIKSFNENSKMEIGLNHFKDGHSKILAPSLKEFPNSHWNNEESTSVCVICSFFSIYSHIVFNRNETFINSNSFKISWLLNKTINFISTNIKNILALNIIDLSIKIQNSLGFFNLLGIEIISRRYKLINNKDKKYYYSFYSLPIEITKIISNKNIASLISQTKEPFVLDCILKGEFRELLNVTNLLISKSNGCFEKNINTITDKDHKLSFIRYKNRANHLKELILILPQIYLKIQTLFNKEV